MTYTIRTPKNYPEGVKSKVLQRIALQTYRKVKFCVDAYAKMIVSGVKQRVHYYFDWKSFNVGFGFCRTTGITGWKYMLSLDLGFLAVWVYFVNIKK